MIELHLRGLAVQRQKELDVIYKGHRIKGLKIDLLVEEQVIVELKSVSKMPEVATRRLCHT